MDILHSLFGFYSGSSMSRVLAFVAPALAGVALKVPKAARAELAALSRDVFHQPSEPLDPALHWARVAAVVEGASQSAGRVRDMQSDALVRIEMAEYALGRLVVDIADIMPAPSRATTSGVSAASSSGPPSNS